MTQIEADFSEGERVSYLVRLDNNRLVRCHQDHLRKRTVGHSAEIPHCKREDNKTNEDNEIDGFVEVLTRPSQNASDPIIDLPSEPPDPPNTDSQLDGGPETSQASGLCTSDCTDHQGSPSAFQVPRKTYPMKFCQHPDYYQNFQRD